MTKSEKQIIENQIIIMEALKRVTPYPHIEEEFKDRIIESEKLLKAN